MTIAVKVLDYVGAETVAVLQVVNLDVIFTPGCRYLYSAIRGHLLLVYRYTYIESYFSGF